METQNISIGSSKAKVVFSLPNIHNNKIINSPNSIKKLINIYSYKFSKDIPKSKYCQKKYSKLTSLLNSIMKKNEKKYNSVQQSHIKPSLINDTSIEYFPRLKECNRSITNIKKRPNVVTNESDYDNGYSVLESRRAKNEFYKSLFSKYERQNDEQFKPKKLIKKNILRETARKIKLIEGSIINLKVSIPESNLNNK